MPLAMENIKAEEMSESKYFMKAVKVEYTETPPIEYFMKEPISDSLQEQFHLGRAVQIKTEPESDTDANCNESKSDNKNGLNIDIRCKMVLESMKREKWQLKRAGVCKRCGAKCGTEQHLQQHISQFHIVIPPIPSSGFICDVARNIRPADTFACYKCPELFRTYRQREHHQFVHRQVSANQCRYCNKHFRTIAKVRTHTKYAHSNWNSTPRFLCRICYRPFYNSNRYEGHLQYHRDENKFKCTICWKYFEHLLPFKDHLINEHSAEMNSIENSASLEKERMEKKHDFSYSGPISLVDLISEPTEIDVKCDLKNSDNLKCNQEVKWERLEPTASIKQEMNVDIPETLEQYHCEMCPQSHSSKESLVRHIRGHMKKGFLKRFKCQICKTYYFQTKRQCDNHVQTKHKNSKQFDDGQCSQEMG